MRLDDYTSENGLSRPERLQAAGASLRCAGRKTKAPACDTMIAAAAVAKDLDLHVVRRRGHGAEAVDS
ncbi:MAG: hypothetical protein ACYCSF_06090 [Acidimicrobiales bacterium]